VQLSVREACEALAMDWTRPNGLIFDASLRSFDTFRIVNLCSSLVTVDTSQPGGNAQDMLLRLAHPSVRKFLLTDDSDTSPAGEFKVFNMPSWLVPKYLPPKGDGDTSPAGKFNIMLGSGHAAMARACIIYRLQLDSLNGADPDQYPLAQYAASHWAYHLIRATRTADIETLVWPFFDEDAPHFQTWLRFFDINRRCGRRTQLPEGSRTRRTITPLYCASSLGLYDVCERLLQRDADPNEDSPDGLWKMPLAAANVYKHGRTYELLQRSGAVECAYKKLEEPPFKRHAASVFISLP